MSVPYLGSHRCLYLLENKTNSKDGSTHQVKLFVLKHSILVSRLYGLANQVTVVYSAYHGLGVLCEMIYFIAMSYVIEN